MVTVECWQLLVRGKLRTTFDCPDAAASAAAKLARQGIRVHVRHTTRRKPGMLQPTAPTAAARHREQQHDRMFVLRQATTYYKSGSNGTEVPQLPR